MEEQEILFKPVAPGDFKLSSKEAERVELPNNKTFTVTIDEVQKTEFDGVAKLVLVFHITKPLAFKDQTFKKFVSVTANPKSTLAAIANIALGELPDELDPTVLVGKSLKVYFTADNFEGRAYQKATYMPSDDEDDDLAKAQEVFEGATEA